MSKIRYEDRRFTEAAREVVRQAEAFCTGYANQGYSLTLRQLYYRFIATDAFPESRRDKVLGTKNTQQNYKWLGSLVSDARIAGLIDWSHLEDRTRESQGGDGGYGSPERAMQVIAEWYSISHWDGQAEYVEVWIEKDALVDVISRPCSEWNVRYMACKGYLSQSEMHEAANRLRRQERAGRKTTVIHLGDHDPSGLDMTEDTRRRLAMFRCATTVDRIALNMDQVDDMQPPPSPAKITDSRANEYIEMYGEDSWELDAIEPAELERLTRDAILLHVDQDAYQDRVDREERERAQLVAISDNWDTIRDYMINEGMAE